MRIAAPSPAISGPVPGPVTAAAGVADAGYPPVPPLPSGLDVRLQEVILDVKPDGTNTYVRYRFVAPGLAGEQAPDFEARMADMQYLCEAYALPLERETLERADFVVISIADRETSFGAPDPSAMQFFESFRIESGACIWEPF